MTLQTYKEDRNKHSLAVTDGSNHLLLSLFNKSFLVIHTQISKLELFLKKPNTLLYQNDHMQESLLAVDIRYHKGMIIANHLSCIKIYSFVGGKVEYIESLDLQLGCSPMQNISVDTSTDSVRVIRKL